MTGGTTLLPGFIDRLQNELQTLAPGMKIKIRSFSLSLFFSYLSPVHETDQRKFGVDAPASSAERTHSSWLGGSILASLGTFHQVSLSSSVYCAIEY